MQLEEWRYEGESYLLDRDAKMVYHPPSAPGAAPAVAGRFQAGDLVPLSEDAVAPAPAVSSAAPERDTSAPSLTVDTSRPFAGSATPLFASPRLDMDALPPPSAAFAPLAPLPPSRNTADARASRPYRPSESANPNPPPPIRPTTSTRSRPHPRRPRPRPRASAPLDASSAPPFRRRLRRGSLDPSRGDPRRRALPRRSIYERGVPPPRGPRGVAARRRSETARGRRGRSRRRGEARRHGSGDRVDLFAELDLRFLRTRRARLREVFDAHDADGDGNLDARELNALLVDVVPSVSPAQERYFAVMLGVGVDGDAGRRVSFDGFVGAIREARAAGLAVVAGRDDEIPPALASLHEFMRRHDVTASRVFADADADGDQQPASGESAT